MESRPGWVFTHVLLADDSSEHAHGAAKLLCDLPFKKDIRITVLRAFPSTLSADLYTLEEHLQKTCEVLKDAGYDPKPELMLGSPSEKIMEFVESHHPELILLGAKGLRSTLGILLGGVAQQVVEYACCPVMIVRAPYRGLKRILLVTDGSAYSEEAVKYITSMPLPVDAEITAMHVLSPPPPPLVLVEPGYIGPQIKQPLPVNEADAEKRLHQEKEGETLLKRTEDKLKAHGLKTNTILKQGDAATEIIQYVDSNNIDLIVTGSRGLSQVKAWLLGSVSRKLVHYSNCSILVVRKPEIHLPPP